MLAFSAGMAAVLVAVGWLAWKFKSAAIGLDRNPKWQRRFGLGVRPDPSALGLYSCTGIADGRKIRAILSIIVLTHVSRQNSASDALSGTYAAPVHA